MEGEEEESRWSFSREESRSSSKSKLSKRHIRTMSLIFPELFERMGKANREEKKQKQKQRKKKTGLEPFFK